MSNERRWGEARKRNKEMVKREKEMVKEKRMTCYVEK